MSLSASDITAGMTPSVAQAGATTVQCHRPADNSRLFVISDIGNEPDDAESLVRLLLYTNEIDLEGLVASTSTWQRDQTHPEMMRARIDAYGRVVANLRVHDCRYPDAEMLSGLVASGSEQYGMRGVGSGRDTQGSRALVAAIDKDDPRPLWIALWGGGADLAQTLWTLRETRTPAQVATAVRKIRVYAISDQDDAGPWVRRNFPELFWVGSIHAFNDYALATWRGFSGDLYRQPDVENPPPTGPDGALVTNRWLQDHIRRGALGDLYPPWLYAMEGDTPSFLNLVRNGLSDPDHPEWGGWGGRYGKVSPDDGLFADASDLVIGKDGKAYQSGQATIWRWRAAYQNDFAARIAWSVTPSYRSANHAPVAIINADDGDHPLIIRAAPGQGVDLDASKSHDPDGDALSFDWQLYPEAGAMSNRGSPELIGADSSRLRLHVPMDMHGNLHVVLEIKDNGSPALVRYRRVIVTSTP